ncbi:MAG: lipid A biosynthesis acyltransferase [Betaproteobacteria bacterium]|nr:lipid A biosynthesis acyltransferase [Betaproteobacteria bacterium]
MKSLFARLSIGVVWLLHLLPYPVLAALGTAVGWLLWPLARSRRRITLRNLQLCFPDWTAAQQHAVARQHFVFVARAFLERGVLWYASPKRLQRLLHLEGPVEEALDGSRNTLLLGFHFEGLDAGWTALSLVAPRPVSGMYTPQKNKVLDDWVVARRSRFHTAAIVSRHDGAAGMLRQLKAGVPFYTLPDMDFGLRSSRFIDFFGVPAATLDVAPRLAASADARVYAVVTRILPGARGYAITVHPAWADFPALDARGKPADIDADLRRMNRFIEEQVRTMPAQYHWVHKRFKNRPEGEPSLY